MTSPVKLVGSKLSLVTRIARTGLGTRLEFSVKKETDLMVWGTPRQNVYACASLNASGHFFSHTFLSNQSLPRALGFILCAACGSVVLLHAARVFDYFVVTEIAFIG